MSLLAPLLSRTRPSSEKELHAQIIDGTIQTREDLEIKSSGLSDDGREDLFVAFDKIVLYFMSSRPIPERICELVAATHDEDIVEVLETVPHFVTAGTIIYNKNAYGPLNEEASEKAGQDISGKAIYIKPIRLLIE